MDSETFDYTRPVNLQLGSWKKSFSPIASAGFAFSSDEQGCLIDSLSPLSAPLQTHRELDGIGDSEGRRYGALHRTTEAVRVSSLMLCCRCLGSFV